jgi:P2 family phage contractile tail tube protein
MSGTSQFPRAIVRNFNLYLGSDMVDLLGQCSKAKIKLPKRKTEELFNAGMAMGMEIAYGAYEKPEVDFTITGILPEIFEMYALEIGKDFPFLLAAAAVDESTGQVHSSQYSGFGFLKEADMDDFEAHGKKHENKFQLAPRQIKWTYNGREILYFDNFTVRRNGVDTTAAIKRALLVG